MARCVAMSGTGMFRLQALQVSSPIVHLLRQSLLPFGNAKFHRRWASAAETLQSQQGVSGSQYLPHIVLN